VNAGGATQHRGDENRQRRGERRQRRRTQHISLATWRRTKVAHSSPSCVTPDVSSSGRATPTR
jgi:hypothetical protein